MFVEITGQHDLMHKKYLAAALLLILLLLAALWLLNRHPPLESPQYNGHPWVTGYLPAYHHNGREIPFMVPDDYAMLTHIAHASVIPRPDGSLDTDTNSYLPESRRKAVQSAHANNRPILLVITGQHEQFSPAISPTVQQAFIRNILQILDADGYDGVDIDMEPVTLDENQDNPDFRAFITELHKALQTRTSPLLGRAPLLTTATIIRDRHIMAQLADKFDQINLMSYDMAQPYEGWISWFDSPLHNGGLVFPGFSHEVPSIENWLNAFLEAGVPRRKLGLGISFDVACWQGGETSVGQGVTLPRESWRTPPSYFKRSYADMRMQNRIPDTYQWDDVAQMAWFSADAADPAQDMFCNFNDARALAAKIDFARQQGLGGIMIWELALDAMAQPATGSSRPLRQAIEAELQK
ncbi:glycoside hydrolase family 18 protein [Candidatus Thiothrix sp. Deng01]|uniref:chitinase n=1 Tax=Candidatus Thiothrix phosphatis TaxID=3112415 RepID=A0ABU6CWC8_9GAMM|nr:glycoside hydrolase family 18 protein [Candidatus Thiothrix sp. Deng01]MEB4591129.1 glycoside hydrolase family 18 protein [Candidatus Thiothrix sp. Deng01]